MSTQVNQYILYGVRVPYENESYEKYEEFCDNPHDPDIRHRHGLCVLFDGRDGEYIMIGRVLAKSPEGNPLPSVRALTPPSADMTDMIRGAIEREFKLDNPEMKLWLVTHLR